MVIDALLQAVQSFAHPAFLLAIVTGVITGLIFGIIPGVSSILALSLFLPFAFSLDPKIALTFMVAVTAVTYFGGSVTAILLNVPGTEASAATLLDGYPMAQKGEGGRALGASFMSSAMGAVITVIIALAMIPLILPMIYAISTGDMVFIVLLGIAFITLIGQGAMVKGLISGGLGILFSLIGFQWSTGVARFTFDIPILYEGIPIAPFALGLFAVPEMIALAAKGGNIVKEGTPIKGMRDVWEGATDVFRHWGLWLRCSIIGYIIGIIPGIGTMVSTFVCYAHAKQSSKHPEKFGQGAVEGVIAPEAANNATCSGAVLTTLALGIPGSAPMVLLLGGFTMVGLIPGPSMLTEHLDLSLALLLAVLAANALAVVICFPIAQHLAKIGLVPARILAPLVIVLALIGAFAVRGEYVDVLMTLIFGALGLAMRRWNYNRVALLLGFVLGVLFERNLFVAISMSGPLFFLTPLSLSLIVITIGVLVYEPVKNALARRRKVKTA